MASTLNARNTLALALKPALGRKFNIFPAPSSLDTITKPTLVLVRNTVEKLPAAPGGHLLNTFGLWVICPLTLTEKSEDALDDLLDEVTEALDEISATNWTSADRDLWNETNPAYRITLTAHSRRK